MEDLFEFLFGASSRINRVQYWRSLLIVSIAGLCAAVILFTAASIAAPLFIVIVVLIFIPWVMWGFAIHTEWLHDRNTSAWWLLVFSVVPAVLGQLAKAEWFAGGAGMVLQYILALAGFALMIWGFVESAAGAVPGGQTNMAPTHSPTERRCLRYVQTRKYWTPRTKTKKRPVAVRPPGE
jgi:uncharacterized membrane protein YhaH (DUF805 family)